LKETYDVGTGGGFPGVIFAIRYPTKQMTLCEKLQKKRAYLSELIEHLGLRNVKILPELNKNEKRRGLFFARAVFSGVKYFNYFLEVASPGSVLVRNIGGSTIDDFAYPSGIKLKETKEYELPCDEGRRKLQFFEIVSRGTKIG
jgi:16S rRNA (guanine527-N7)-methyltransferase